MKSVATYLFYLLLSIALLCCGSCAKDSREQETLAISLKEKSSPAYYYKPINMPISKISDLWFDSTGNEGWAIGDLELVLHYKNGSWTRAYDNVDSGSRMFKLWMNENGTEGWAIGSVFLHFKNNKWTKVLDGYPQDYHDLLMAENGNEGWAAGDNGAIRHLKDGEWKLDQVASNDFAATGFAMDAKGTIWASCSRGVIYYKGGTWNYEAKDGFLNFIWISPSGNEGWAGGDDGVLLHYTMGSWQKVKVEIKQNSKGKFQQTGHVRHVTGKYSVNGSFIEDETPLKDCNLNKISMSSNGQEGWIIGDKGIVLHLKNGNWKQEYIGLTNSYLTAIDMNASFTEGWISGANGVLLRYQNERWKSEKKDIENDINAVFVDKNHNKLWIAAGNSIIAKSTKDSYSGTSRQTLNLNSNSLNKIWLSKSHHVGWAAGDKGSILQWANNQWTNIPIPDSINFNFLTFKSKGNEGWAADSLGNILHYVNHEWHKAPLAVKLKYLKYSEETDQTLAMGTTGNLTSLFTFQNNSWLKLGAFESRDITNLYAGDPKSGIWLIGKKGSIIQFIDGNFKNASPGQLVNNLNDIWFDHNSETGLIVGNQGLILRYHNGKWVQSEKLTNSDLFSITMNKDASEGWIGGEEGIVLDFKNGEWMNDNTGDSEYNIFNIKYDQRQNMAWALSNYHYDDMYYWNKNSLVYFKNNQWHKLPKVAKMGVRDVAFNSDNNPVVVGDYGLLGELQSITKDTISILPEDEEKLSNLKGTVTLNLNRKVKTLDHIYLAGLEDINLIKDKHYSVELDSSRLKVIIKFINTKDIISKYNHEKFRLGLGLSYFDILSDELCYLETNKTFHIDGVSGWVYGSLAVIAAFFLNIILVCFATRNKFIRRLIFHPVGSKFIGLFVGKFLITDTLIHFVKPLRLALFRDYKRSLQFAPFIANWKSDRRYIPPSIKLQGGTQIYEWPIIIGQIVQNGPDKVWTLIGRSGLGKTALLENWTNEALRSKLIPVFIRLGSESSLIDLINNQVQHYGEINLSNKYLNDILKWGGFLLILDGLNEDRHPEETESLIRQLVKNNIIIISGHDKPNNLFDVNLNEVNLSPFDIDQLSLLMGEHWARRASSVPELSDIITLPQTAHLLSKYIDKHGTLPNHSLDIYSDLSKVEGDNSLELTNQLSLKAWEMFSAQEITFESDNTMPVNFCDISVNAGILTKSSNKYKFRHERIHRYYVARYIFSIENFDITVWDSRLKIVPKEGYWYDVVEFIGEMFAMEIHNTTLNTDKVKISQSYKDFVSAVYSFNKDMFKKRIYSQAVKFYSTNLIGEDADFLLMISQWMSFI